MVDWIEQNVEVSSRRRATAFAQELLSAGYFRHVLRSRRFHDDHPYEWIADEVGGMLWRTLTWQDLNTLVFEAEIGQRRVQADVRDVHVIVNGLMFRRPTRSTLRT